MPSVTGNIYCSGMAARLMWAVAIGGVALGGACSKKAPVVQAPPRPLEVPVVPPRLVGPVVVEEEPAVPTAEAPEPTPPRQRAPHPVARGNGTEPIVKVEPPPETAKPPETPNGQPSTSATNAQAGPAPLLRTPETADAEGVAKSVRETLARAEQNLNKVNYQALNPGAKAQHDSARRFIAQANDALKKGSLEFARFLAEKADRLSASLLK